jgi:organic hydroperoxide reductase OsmC/OhrA
MAKHRALISWKAETEPVEVLAGRYLRRHTWTFDGGLVVSASSSPSVVPLPFSDPSAVDPEEAFVAALSSCHMLTFIHEARKQGLAVVSYDDEAVGEMTKNERGVPFISRVMLTPVTVFAPGQNPPAEEVARLHHLAHENCFISQSVKTVVEVKTATILEPAAPGVHMRRK